MHTIITKKSGTLVLLFLFLILINSYPGTTSAVLATGRGDGSGGGKGQPLSLTSSIPADGQKDVSPTTEILLSFSKNVVYMTVCKNNKKCLALYAADGSKIPVEVIMADDQIEPEKRRDIQLKPLQSLEPATSYTIKISPELRSKSGVTVGREITVSFTTAGAAPDSVSENNKGSSPVQSFPDSAVSSPGGTTAENRGSKESPAPAGGDGVPASSGSAGRSLANEQDSAAGKETSPVEQVPDALPGEETSTVQDLAENSDTANEAVAEETARILVDGRPAPFSKGRPIALGLVAAAAVLGYVFYRRKKSK